MILGLVVLPGGVMGAGELQTDPGQVGADGEDRLVLFGGLTRPTEAHVDRAQQEAPFDGLVFVGRPGLLQERQRILEAPGLHQQTAGRQIRYLGSGGRSVGRISGLRVRPDGDQGRQGARGKRADDPGCERAPSRPQRDGSGFPSYCVSSCILAPKPP